MKILISASSKEAAEVSLNAYFYSTTYRIREDGAVCFTPAGKDEKQNTNLKYKVVKNRHKIYIL